MSDPRYIVVTSCETCPWLKRGKKKNVCTYQETVVLNTETIPEWCCLPVVGEGPDND